MSATAISNDGSAVINQTIDTSASTLRSFASSSSSSTSSSSSSSPVTFHAYYDIAACAAFVVEMDARRVALQMPDALLPDATAVHNALQTACAELRVAATTASSKSPSPSSSSSSPSPLSSSSSSSSSPPLTTFYVLGDTSYGSCCVDEVAAQHIDAGEFDASLPSLAYTQSKLHDYLSYKLALTILLSFCTDALLHYGHACLSATRRLPVRYVFGRAPVCVRAVADAVATHLPPLLSTGDDDASGGGDDGGDGAVDVVVMYDLVFEHAAAALRAELTKHAAAATMPLDVIVADVCTQIDNGGNNNDGGVGGSGSGSGGGAVEDTSIGDSYNAAIVDTTNNEDAAAEPADDDGDATDDDDITAAAAATVVAGVPSDESPTTAAAAATAASAAAAVAEAARTHTFCGFTFALPPSQPFLPPVAPSHDDDGDDDDEGGDDASGDNVDGADVATATDTQKKTLIILYLTAGRSADSPALTNLLLNAAARDNLRVVSFDVTGLAVVVENKNENENAADASVADRSPLPSPSPAEASSLLRVEGASVNRTLARRYYLMCKVRDANMIGILVGTLGVARYLDIIKHLQERITAAGKRWYLVLVGKVNDPKLANLSELDVFVLVACPLTSMLDSKEFVKDVVTPFECELALTPRRQWTGQYATEFAQLLPDGRAASNDAGDVGVGDEGGDCNGEDDAEDDGMHYSMVTRSLQRTVRTRGGGEVSSSSSSSASMASTALVANDVTALSMASSTALTTAATAVEYMAARAFKGLDPLLNSGAISVVQEGLGGIARSSKDVEAAVTDGQRNFNAGTGVGASTGTGDDGASDYDGDDLADEAREGKRGRLVARVKKTPAEVRADREASAAAARAALDAESSSSDEDDDGGDADESAGAADELDALSLF
jgi:diphthamide synthase subunit DPH2